MAKLKLEVAERVAVLPTTIFSGLEEAVPSQPKTIDPIGARRFPAIWMESANMRSRPPAESGREGVDVEVTEIAPLVAPLS